MLKQSKFRKMWVNPDSILWRVFYRHTVMTDDVEDIINALVKQTFEGTRFWVQYAADFISKTNNEVVKLQCEPLRAFAPLLGDTLLINDVFVCAAYRKLQPLRQAILENIGQDRERIRIHALLSFKRNNHLNFGFC